MRALAWAPISGFPDARRTLATTSFDAYQRLQGERKDEEGRTGEWECASLLEGHETKYKSVAYSSSGTLLASCSRDKTVWIWEVHPDPDFECMACVAWHPVEEILASGPYDNTIKLYVDDPWGDWFCIQTLTGHTSTVWALAWAPDTSSYLASVSDDCTVRIWRRVAQHKWECAARAPWRVAAAGDDGVVRVWELEERDSAVSQRLIAQLPAAHGVHDVNSVVWCLRAGFENMLAATGDNGATRIWRVVPACRKVQNIFTQRDEGRQMKEDKPRADQPEPSVLAWVLA
ncbi:WD40-repeat-containing domain protein [Mycena rebaudengoi]|nr:WD40-repeat-containing domain protein [Mycena rebaudengoi]